MNKSSQKIVGIGAVTLFLGAVIPVQALASLLAYEGFDYTTGTAGTVGIELTGQGTAGDGWNGPWSGSNVYQVVSADMSYTGIPTTGGRIQNDWQRWTNIFRRLDVAGTFGDYAETNDDGDTVIGADGTTLWMSFLLSGKNNSNAQGNWVGMADDFVQNWSATINVGAIKAFDRPWNQVRLFERHAGFYTWPAEDTGVFQDGTAQLMLVEFNFGAANDDTVKLYVNEDAEGDPATFVAEASFSGIDMGFYRIMLGQADTRDAAYGWDEIRIGNTAGDVLPNSAGGEVFGDINDDGIIDDLDLNLLLSDYEADGVGGGGANGYNSTNLQELLENYGTTGLNDAAQGVPEPASMLLMLFGFLGLLTLRRGKQNE